MTRTRLDSRSRRRHAPGVKRDSAIRRVAACFLATALTVALVIHAAHGHDAAPNASQLHATCVVCQLGSPVGIQSLTVSVTAESAPLCQLSIADRDHAIPPARVEVDLSRAPPSLLAN